MCTAPTSGRCATSRSRVEPGSAVGLVGRNGSGKTTLLRLLSGIIKPSAGRVAVGGRVGSLLELGAGFHLDLTGRENVYLNGSIHGLRRTAIREKLDEIVAFAGLEEFIDLPVRTYSSGMYMRLGFAIAAHIEADVLLLDEVFAVGDEAFQRKCFGKIFEFKQRGGTIVFVSHDAVAVERLCDRAVLLQKGAVAFDGPTHEAIVAYRRLLAGERDPEERAAGLKEWGGDVARVERVRLLGPEGDERTQLLAGEPFAIAPTSSRSSRSRRRVSSGSCATTRRSSSPPAACRPPTSAGPRPRARCRCGSRPSGRPSRTGGCTCGSTSPTSGASCATTRSTTRSSSSSIRPTTRAASSASKATGRGRRFPPPQNWRACELAYVPRLARPDGDRARSFSSSTTPSPRRSFPPTR